MLIVLRMWLMLSMPRCTRMAIDASTRFIGWLSDTIVSEVVVQVPVRFGPRSPVFPRDVSPGARRDPRPWSPEG